MSDLHVSALKSCSIFHADISCLFWTPFRRHIPQVLTFQDLETMQIIMAIGKKVHWPTPRPWHVCCAINHPPLCSWCPGSIIPGCISLGKASPPRKSDPNFKYHYCFTFPFVKVVDKHITRRKQWLGACLVLASTGSSINRQNERTHYFRFNM